MQICWHFRKFDWRRFRDRVPAKLIDEWCGFLARRPQGQYHQDQMAAGMASALCAANGHDIPPRTFLFYEHETKPQQDQELSQAQIDVNVQWAMARQPKRPPVKEGG